ncbi:MAG TPA: hypothetical protein VK993_14165 [Chthoniobacterales bacterium]|nr:hypothetical protein [Chthoniobacterales bacterium]
MRRVLVTVSLLAAVSAQAATYTDKATKLRFPDKLGPWEKTKVHHYPEPGLGTSIGYRHPIVGIATIYIYDKGLKKIPSGGTSDAVLEEFALVRQEIEATYSGEEYENLKHVMDAAPKVETNGRTATLLASVYSFGVRGEHPPQRLSYALLTGFRNRFLKLRYTLAADVEKTPERGRTELQQLIAALLAANKQHASGFLDAAGEKKKKEPIPEETAWAAIRDFKRDPLGATDRGAAGTIINFTEASPAVVVSIGKQSVPWLTDDRVARRRSVLLADYVAGNIESQLNRRTKEDDAHAGVLQAIATYHQLQENDPDFRLEELEGLIQLESEGRLKEHLQPK